MCGWPAAACDGLQQPLRRQGGCRHSGPARWHATSAMAAVSMSVCDTSGVKIAHHDRSPVRRHVLRCGASMLTVHLRPCPQPELKSKPPHAAAGGLRGKAHCGHHRRRRRAVLGLGRLRAVRAGQLQQGAALPLPGACNGWAQGSGRGRRRGAHCGGHWWVAGGCRAGMCCLLPTLLRAMHHPAFLPRLLHQAQLRSRLLPCCDRCWLPVQMRVTCTAGAGTTAGRWALGAAAAARCPSCWSVATWSRRRWCRWGRGQQGRVLGMLVCK